MRRASAAFLIVAASAGCKTAAVPTTSGVAAADESKPPQCSIGPGFHGDCQVTDISGRQGTTTEAARESTLGDIIELKLAIPPGGPDAHPSARFFKKAGPADDWTINDAIDLYSRDGCIAEVSGGVFGDGFTPKQTLRVLLNLQDDGRNGFAELADYRSGKAVYATLSLKCDWQK